MRLAKKTPWQRKIDAAIATRLTCEKGYEERLAQLESNVSLLRAQLDTARRARIANGLPPSHDDEPPF